MREGFLIIDEGITALEGRLRFRKDHGTKEEHESDEQVFHYPGLLRP
jgi:hypothetical protein